MRIKQQRKGSSAANGNVWWLNPATAFALPCILAAITAFLTSPSAYVTFWHTPKYFDLPAFGIVLAVVLVFSFGCVVGGARLRMKDPPQPDDWLRNVSWPAVRKLFHLSFVLTMIAYTIWFALAVKNGISLNILLGAMKGSDVATTDIRTQYLGTVPGITTATQFGIGAVILGVPLGLAEGWRSVRWQCGMVFFLASIRSIVNSERLAVIELIVPFLVSLIWLKPARRHILRTFIRFAPVLGGVLLFLFFAMAEYFRSWNGFYVKKESSFWSFIALRLMGYYSTALNNGALLWQTVAPLPIHEPFSTMGFLWHFPVLKSFVPTFFPSLFLDDSKYKDLLTTFANPEFNNPSGIFMPLTDFSLAGGLFYWLACGLAVGFVYGEFKQRSVTGIFLYPALFIALIEASRILYWADGRFVPSFFVLAVGVMFMFKPRRRRYANWPSHSPRPMEFQGNR